MEDLRKIGWWGINPAHNYDPVFFDGENIVANPSVPTPFSATGPIDGFFGRLSDAGIYKGEKKGQKGSVYGSDKKSMPYINDDNRDLLQGEKHALWAAKKIKELNGKTNAQPFFMGISFVPPHTPLHAPDKYFDRYPIDKIELDTWLPEDNNDTFWSDNFDKTTKGSRYYRLLLESYHRDRELALKHFLQAYLAVCVTFVDEQVGTVIDALNNSKFKDNTIVIFTSDHGWQMGEKNYLFKNSLWKESTRVPFLIKTPKTKAGCKVKHPVSLTDLDPTLIEYCNLKRKPKKNAQTGNLEGTSLRPFLERT